MNNDKTLTNNGINLPHLFFIFISIGIVITGLYLTNHYYDVKFPVGLGGGSSACDLSSYFNCDAATFSNISSIFKIPISFFGMFLGIIFLIGSIFPSKGFEQTNKFIILLNAIGCLVLFIYSIVVLGSLCPFCTLYYCLSFASLFLMWKYSKLPFLPEIKSLLIVTILVAILGFVVRQNSIDKEVKQIHVTKQKIKQFFELPNLGTPRIESPYTINKAFEKFEDAPIQMSIFSDFQCPFCKVLSDQLHKLSRRFKDHLNIQYFFYPLDNECNINVKRRFHEYACMAAYIAACDPSKFGVIHDEIFENQDKLNLDYLKGLEKKHNLSGCLENQENKESVKGLIAIGDQFSIKSTPTVIINGVKIEGSLSIPEYIALFEEILKRKK